jgi:phosphatidylinositol alpha 1,6-mannosyltransferase
VGLKIAIVTESFLPSTNGVTNSVLQVVQTLKEYGHEVLIVAPRSPEPQYLGFPVIKTAAIKLFGFPIGLPLIGMKSVLRSFNPDVVHVAAPFMLGRQGLAVAKRLNIPSVAIYQTDVRGYLQRYGAKILTPIYNWILKGIHSKATITLAPTPESASNLQKLGCQNVSIWGRGVDLSLYTPKRKLSSAVRKYKLAIGVQPTDLVVGYVGRLAPEKQVERFLEFTDLPNIQFLIVGDGPERPNLEKLFSNQRVRFVGKQTGDVLANSYAAMDVFVHCGEEETFGQTIQEAKASGIPAIAPEMGGPKFLIEDGLTGFLVDPRKPGAYREALLRLAEDTDLRERMGLEARASMLGRTWKNNNEELISHYESVIEAKKKHLPKPRFQLRTPA